MRILIPCQLMLWVAVTRCVVVWYSVLYLDIIRQRTSVTEDLRNIDVFSACTHTHITKFAVWQHRRYLSKTLSMCNQWCINWQWARLVVCLIVSFSAFCHGCMYDAPSSFPKKCPCICHELVTDSRSKKSNNNNNKEGLLLRAKFKEIRWYNLSWHYNA